MDVGELVEQREGKPKEEEDADQQKPVDGRSQAAIRSEPLVKTSTETECDVALEEEQPGKQNHRKPFIHVGDSCGWCGSLCACVEHKLLLLDNRVAEPHPCGPAQSQP